MFILLYLMANISVYCHNGVEKGDYVKEFLTNKTNQKSIKGLYRTFIRMDTKKMIMVLALIDRILKDIGMQEMLACYSDEYDLVNSIRLRKKDDTVFEKLFCMISDSYDVFIEKNICSRFNYDVLDFPDKYYIAGIIRMYSFYMDTVFTGSFMEYLESNLNKITPYQRDFEEYAEIYDTFFFGEGNNLYLYSHMCDTRNKLLEVLEQIKEEGDKA